MDRIEDILSIIGYALDTRRKRHIVGGVFISVALLFGGLAFTVMSLKEDEDDGRNN